MTACPHCGSPLAVKRYKIIDLCRGSGEILSLQEIADTIGCSFGYAKWVAQNYDLEYRVVPPRPTGTPCNWDRHFDAYALKLSGLSFREVGVRLNISRERVRQIYQKVERRLKHDRVG